MTNSAVSIRGLRERTSGKFVKTSLDLVVLAILDDKPMHGYRIMAAIHTEFGVLLSPGTLYPLLHLLEEKKLVESRVERGKRVYEATSEGRTRFQNAFTMFKVSMNQLETFVKRNGKHSLNDSRHSGQIL